MANYPTSVPSFTNKSAGQTIEASHINGIQDEVVAIGGGLLQGTAPLASSNSTVANLSVLGNSTIAGNLSAGGAFSCTGTQAVSLSSGNTSAVTLDSTTYILSITPHANGSTLEGIAYADAGRGRQIFILNGGGVSLVLAGESANAAAGKRFLAASTLAAGYGGFAVYTGSRWALARHG